MECATGDAGSVSVTTGRLDVRSGGAIVSIGSARENTGQAGLSGYLGAKHAFYGMTKCAALDYGDKGIRINAVAPGPMWTPMPPWRLWTDLWKLWMTGRA